MPPGLELFFYAYPGLRRVAPSPPGYYLSPAQARVLEFRGLRPPSLPTARLAGNFVHALAHESRRAAGSISLRAPVFDLRATLRRVACNLVYFPHSALCSGLTLSAVFCRPQRHRICDAARARIIFFALAGVSLALRLASLPRRSPLGRRRDHRATICHPRKRGFSNSAGCARRTFTKSKIGN